MNTIKAFKVTHTVSGQNWKCRAQFIKAETEAEALQIFLKRNQADPAASISADPVTIYPTSEKIEVANYPYGRLRTSAFFSVEFKAGKGFRSIFQTINPKTGRLNAEKKGTYSAVEFCYMDNVGHIHWSALDFNGTDALNKGIYFLADFSEIFTPEQLKDIHTTVLAMMKINAKAQVVYCGTNWDDLKQHYEKQIQHVCKLIKGEETDILPCLLDAAKIEALKVPDFNPFTVKTYSAG